MTTAYSTNLELALPVQGELSGTWGDTVNNGITQYLDTAIAGSQIISGSQTAVTLTNTNGDASATNIAQVGSGSSGTAQYQIIRCTGNPASLLTITVSDTGTAGYSKTFVIINATSTSQSVKIVGSGPTTGVTVASDAKALVAWNGSDFVEVASSTADGVTTFSAGTTGFTPSTATSGAVTLAGTLGVANGGTGLTTLTANNVVLGNGTSTPLFVAPGTTGNVLTSNGSTWSSTAPAAGTTFSGGTTGFTPSTATSGAVTLAGTLAVANGGTGQTSYTNGQLLIGNTTGNTLTKATLTQGTGITITNSTGSITVANSGVTSVGGTGTVNGLSLSGTVTTTGNLTLGGTLSGVANSALTNSSVTVTAGTGLSGGGAVALGSSVTLTNAGVTSLTAGSGISVSGSTGGVTVTATGGAAGMVLVSTINAASSATIDGLSVFTSTYDSYLIITNGIMSASGSPRLRFQFAVAGAVTTSNTFYLQSSGVVSGGTQTNSGFIEMTLEARGVASGSNANGIAARMFVYDVNSTTRNKYFDGMTNFYSSGAGSPSSLASSGSYQNTSAVTGFRLLWDGGQNFSATGSVRVYGFKNS